MAFRKSAHFRNSALSRYGGRAARNTATRPYETRVVFDRERGLNLTKIQHTSRDTYRRNNGNQNAYTPLQYDFWVCLLVSMDALMHPEVQRAI